MGQPPTHGGRRMSVIHLRRTHPGAPEIRQSRLKRDWMDETYNKHAYQCLPMTVANVSGWELVLPHDVVVTWDDRLSTARVIEGEFTKSGWHLVQNSITGMVSFALGYSIRTEPGIHIALSGSPNFYLDGAFPLAATVPTDWWPDEVNMNWAITKTNTEILFPAGMPYAFFTICRPLDLSEAIFTTSNMWEDQDLVKERSEYNRNKFKKLEDEPWTWTKGIRSGMNSQGVQIGPSFNGLPKLSSPQNAEADISDT